MKEYFYIFHQSSRCILFISENKFLTSQLQSGLLDTSIGYVKGDYDWVDLLLNMHGNKNEDIGYKIENNNLYTINLSSWPIVKDLYTQTSLRLPLFEVLFNIFNIKSARNQVGYTDYHKHLLHYALSNPNCITEYASAFNIDREFAEEELKLIVNSKLEEEFSLFTICEFWRDKINKCYSKDQADNCMQHMLNNFNKPELYE